MGFFFGGGGGDISVRKFDGKTFSVSDMWRKKYSEGTLCHINIVFVNNVATTCHIFFADQRSDKQYFDSEKKTIATLPPPSRL